MIDWSDYLTPWTPQNPAVQNTAMEMGRMGETRRSNLANEGLRKYGLDEQMKRFDMQQERLAHEEQLKNEAQMRALAMQAVDPNLPQEKRQEAVYQLVSMGAMAEPYSPSAPSRLQGLESKRYAPPTEQQMLGQPPEEKPFVDPNLMSDAQLAELMQKVQEHQAGVKPPPLSKEVRKAMLPGTFYADNAYDLNAYAPTQQESVTPAGVSQLSPVDLGDIDQAAGAPTPQEQAATAAFDKRYGGMGLGAGDWHAQLEANPQPGQPLSVPAKFGEPQDIYRNPPPAPLGFGHLPGSMTPLSVPEGGASYQPAAAAPVAAPPPPAIGPLVAAPAPAQAAPSGAMTIKLPDGQRVLAVVDHNQIERDREKRMASMWEPLLGDAKYGQAARLALSTGLGALPATTFDKAYADANGIFNHITGLDAQEARAHIMAGAQMGKERAKAEGKESDTQMKIIQDAIRETRSSNKWASVEDAERQLNGAYNALHTVDPTTGMPQIAASEEVLRSLIGGRIPVQMLNRTMQATGVSARAETTLNELLRGGQLSEAHTQGLDDIIKASRKMIAQEKRDVAQTAYDLAMSYAEGYPGIPDAERRRMAGAAYRHFAGVQPTESTQPAAAHTGAGGPAPKKGAKAADDFLNSIGVK